MAAAEPRHAVGDGGRLRRVPFRQPLEQPRPFEAVAGLDNSPVLALDRPKLLVEIFEQRAALRMNKRPGAEARDMLGVPAPARSPARLVQRDEALEQMHVRVLAVGRADGDLALEIAAMGQPPGGLEGVSELVGDDEQVRAPERPPRMREREQHERLIVEIGPRVECLAVVVEAVNVEPVAAAPPIDEKVDVGVDHLPPRPPPAEPAEFTVGEDMPRLHEEPVRADVPFAAYREALGKQRGRAVRLGPPEIAGRFEQPLPSIRGDGL